MAVTVLLEVKAKAGTGENVIQMLREILPDTRKFDGAIGVETLRNQDDPDAIVLIERWQSRAHYEKYLAWREETGFVGKLVAVIDGPPSIRYFDLTDA